MKITTIWKKLPDYLKGALGIPHNEGVKAKLIKINEKEIPENALDPELWEIPEGYYAIKVEE